MCSFLCLSALTFVASFIRKWRKYYLGEERSVEHVQFGLVLVSRKLPLEIRSVAANIA